MKNKKSKFIYALLLSVVFAFSFALTGCNKGTENEPQIDQNAWKTDFVLPTRELAKENLNTLYGGEEYNFHLGSDGGVYRMPCPTQGETIDINLVFTIDNEYAKEIFEDSIEEFNFVFSYINPHYNFKINYNPTAEDLKKQYSVKVNAVESFGEGSTTLGNAPHGKYAGVISNFNINIKQSVLNVGSQIMHVVKHELMHLLGAGDAYNNSKYTKNTIMQSYSGSGNYCFTSSDVAFLNYMYRNSSAPKSEKQIRNLINNYETITFHSAKQVMSKTYENAIKNISNEQVLTKLAELDYTSTLTENLNTLFANNLTYNTNFGKQSTSIGEELYNTNTNDSWYYHYAFEITTEKATCSGNKKRYKNVSTNVPTCNIKVYNNGIVVLATNEDAFSHFLINVDNYVLSFSSKKSEGEQEYASFNNLSALNSINLEKVYSLTSLSASAWFSQINV